MGYTRSVTIDFGNSVDLPVVRVKQGDALSRVVDVTLVSGSYAWEPEDDVTFTFRCRRPDGIVLSETLPDASDDHLELTLTEDICEIIGRCNCDIAMSKDGNVLSTASFIINVILSPDTEE